MKLCLATFICLGLAAWGMPGFLARAAKPGVAPVSTEALVTLPSLSRPSLSPDGEHIAVLVPVDGRLRLAVFRWDALAAPVKILAELQASELKRFHWLNPDRLLIRQEFKVKRGRRFFIETVFTAIDRDGRRATVLHRELRPLVGSRRVKAGLVDLLAGDPNHILLSFSRTDTGYPAVFRVDVQSGAKAKVVKSRNGVHEWLADQNGIVRLAVADSGSASKILWRRHGDGRWRGVKKFESGKGEVFAPLAFVAGSDRIHVLSNHESDRDSVYEFDLATGTFGPMIFGHPTVDARGLILTEHRTRLAGIHYILEHSEVHFLDSALKAEQAAIDSLLPGKVNRFLSLSADGGRAVIHSGEPAHPGAYFLWERERRKLIEFGSRHPRLDGATLAAMTPVRYRARDGLVIPGYLTLPQGVEPENLATVILPHGGPLSRETQDFDYWAQFLASRGYAVLQPNIRGSTGFGRAHLSAGYLEWGQAMQDDLADGVAWLIGRGVADPDRVCIVGASFGGYAALMGVVRTPGLYKCAVSFAGLSDLPLGISHGQGYMRSAIHSRSRGKTVFNDRQLIRTSPARRAKQIEAPVLLAHGEDDKVVSVVHTRLMAAAMERADKPYELLILKDGTHHLSLEKNRQVFFRKLEAFLRRHLGPGALAAN